MAVRNSYFSNYRCKQQESPTCTTCLKSTVPCWLLSLEARETPQYTSNFYCNMPPICTAVRLPFVPAILLRKYQWLGGTRKFVSWRLVHTIELFCLEFCLGGILLQLELVYLKCKLFRLQCGALRKGRPSHGSRRKMKFRMQAVKWVVAKLQGDKTASFCRE